MRLRKILAVVPVLVISVFVLSVAAQAFSQSRRFSDIVALARIADENNGLAPELLAKPSLNFTPSSPKKSAVRISSKPG